MGRKSFKDMNTKKAETGVNTGEMYTELERGKSSYQQQGTASAEEQKERAEKLQTQGRKGCKAVRINMAFSPANYEFIKVVSAVTGQTMTHFINFVMEQYRLEHPDIYEQAKQVIDMVNKTGSTDSTEPAEPAEGTETADNTENE